jgi:uncharacterized DUF497 family protein
MAYEWDESKRLSNLKKHGVDFADIEEFDWKGSIRWQDRRKEYGEDRYSALGDFRGRVHSVSFTTRNGNYRIISFRKASERETKLYEEEKPKSES